MGLMLPQWGYFKIPWCGDPSVMRFLILGYGHDWARPLLIFARMTWPKFDLIMFNLHQQSTLAKSDSIVSILKLRIVFKLLADELDLLEGMRRETFYPINQRRISDSNWFYEEFAQVFANDTWVKFKFSFTAVLSWEKLKIKRKFRRWKFKLKQRKKMKQKNETKKFIISFTNFLKVVHFC